ncbi:hypothetical protein JIN77_12015 [Verrucomicrobiaceae bacterium R5-34]|nr:hypothetical protein [Verrucomicrobiaceae bacterium R5-34]
MVKVSQLSVIIVLLASYMVALAQERAWDDASEPIAADRYVYASMSVPPDTYFRISEIEDVPNLDPFGADVEKIKAARDKLLAKHAPPIPLARLPKCLPLRSDYRNLSEHMIKNGVALKGNEWALLGIDHEGYARIYFCTTQGNADLIEQIFTGFGPNPPRNINQLATLVSVQNTAFQHRAWTMENLLKLTPVVHARYGIHGRSGEKTSIQYTAKNQQLADYETEVAVGENNELLDLRLTLSNQFLTPAIQINLETALTISLKDPFVLDCGMHGKKQRNYFLVLQSQLSNKGSYNRLHPVVSLEKIDGIYAFPTKVSPVQKSQIKAHTQIYRANQRFFQDLRLKVESHGNDADPDPFDGGKAKTHTCPKPPVRIKSPKDTPYFQSSDLVYNITPHMRHLGIPLFQTEWIYFNKTQSQLIIHGGANIHTAITRYARVLSPTPNMIKIQAQIVSVDREGVDMPDWDLAKVTQANPKILTQYSSTARSGERATSGAVVGKTTISDPQSGETKNLNFYEFEIEPVLSENSDRLDLRYYLSTRALGEAKQSITLSSAITIPDGKPTIVELGHPNSASRTHLLILHADVITPDGSYYRDRFKALE